MSYKIGEHDYEVRKKQALKFLGKGDKVRRSPTVVRCRKTTLLGRTVVSTWDIIVATPDRGCASASGAGEVQHALPGT